jgi:hypothetical protein
MLIFIREKLVEHLQQSTNLVQLYQNRDGLFAEAVLNWLAATEETLSQLRHPLISLVAAERARILAARDGFREPSLGSARITARKAMSAIAALAIDRVQADLRGAINTVDLRLDAMREKMAQLLAVATTKTPIPMPPTDPRELWLSKVWSGLNVNGDTQGMYRYLCAALTSSDRLQILDEVLTNLIEGLQPP